MKSFLQRLRCNKILDVTKYVLYAISKRNYVRKKLCEIYKKVEF